MINYPRNNYLEEPRPRDASQTVRTKKMIRHLKPSKKQRKATSRKDRSMILVKPLKKQIKNKMRKSHKPRVLFLRDSYKRKTELDHTLDFQEHKKMMKPLTRKRCRGLNQSNQ